MSKVGSLRADSVEASYKFVMILSHGNVRVESGFSANEKMLVENMS